VVSPALLVHSLRMVQNRYLSSLDLPTINYIFCHCGTRTHADITQYVVLYFLAKRDSIYYLNMIKMTSV
jgi:hypothetical protein